jgi:hypothetical protein
MGEEAVELELSVEPQLAREDVPWKRSGSPNFENKGSKWSAYVDNRGLAPHRLVDDKKLIDIGARMGGRVPIGYLEERSLAEYWDYENNGKCNTRRASILHLLVNSGNGPAFLRNDREVAVAEVVAATVIQWLGTNIGRGFLEQAFDLARNEQKRLEPEVLKHMKFLQSVGELPAYVPVVDTLKCRRLKKKAVKGKK